MRNSSHGLWRRPLQSSWYAGRRRDEADEGPGVGNKEGAVEGAAKDIRSREVVGAVQDAAEGAIERAIEGVRSSLSLSE